jgi:hypothetical protein
MTEDGSQPVPDKLRRWWKSTFCLVLWAILGWSWLWAWPPFGAFHRIDEHRQQEKRKKQEGANHGLVSDLHSALAKAVSTPAYMSKLTGVSEAIFEQEPTCTLVWTDEDRTHVAALRAGDAQPAVGWMAITRSGQTTVGRYTMNVWYEACDQGNATDTFYRSECTKIARLRLEERLASPVASTAGIRILPGQCVLGSMEQSETAAGYVLQLPARKNVTIRLYSVPAEFALRPHLFMNQVEISPMQGRSGAFTTSSDGDYELRIERDPNFPGKSAGQYSLQVHWGKAAGPRCPIPSLDHHDCYRAAEPMPGLDAGVAR